MEQILTGDILVQGSLAVDNYYQDSWNVGDVDVYELLEQTIKTSQDVHFPTLHFGALVTFNFDLTFNYLLFPILYDGVDHLVVNNINTNSTIQNIRVSEDLIRKSADRLQSVSGRKSFKSPLISTSMYVGNRINGEDPSKLCDVPPRSQPTTWIIKGNFDSCFLNFCFLIHF